eukprot:866536-Karenia_brevis.AAC.1
MHIHTVNTAELQTYLDEAWEKYVKSEPHSEEPIAIRRAKWSRLTFYRNIWEFILSKSMREMQLAHRFDDGLFVPLFPKQSLIKDDVDVLRAQHVAKQVEEVDLKVVDA